MYQCILRSKLDLLGFSQAFQIGAYMQYICIENDSVLLDHYPQKAFWKGTNFSII
jgi:hypothetical protein